MNRTAPYQIEMEHPIPHAENLPLIDKCWHAIPPSIVNANAADIVTDNYTPDAAQKLDLKYKGFWANALHDLSTFGEEVSKGVVRGVIDIVGGYGTLAVEAGTMIKDGSARRYSKKLAELTPWGMLASFGESLSFKAWGGEDENSALYKKQQQLGDLFVKVGKAVEKFADYAVNTPELKPSEEIFAGSIFENPSATRIATTLMGAVPSLLVLSGMNKIAGPVAAYTVFGMGDNSDILKETRDRKDISDEKRRGLFAVATAGTMLMDLYTKPLELIFGKQHAWLKGLSGKMSRAGMAALTEGVNEVGQQGIQNLVKRFGYDNTYSLLTGLFESFIAGAVAGGSGRLGTDMQYQKIADKINANMKPDENGVMPKPATVKDVEDAMNAILPGIDKDGKVSEAFYQGILEQLSKFDQMVEKLGDSPEGQRLKQWKREINSIGEQLMKAYEPYLNGQGMEADDIAGVRVTYPGDETQGAENLPQTNETVSEAPIQGQEEITAQQAEELRQEAQRDNDGEAIQYQAPISKMATFDEFYDDVTTDKSYERYFRQNIGGYDVDVMSYIVNHDKNRHSLSKDEWKGIFQALNDGKIIEAKTGQKSRFKGFPVKMVIDVNGTEYGAIIEHIPSNGRNFIASAFKYTDKQWMNGGAQVIARKPLSVGSQLGHPLSDIMAYIDGEIKAGNFTQFTGKQKNTGNNAQFQHAFAGSRVDYDKPSLEAIGSGMNAQIHGYGLYYSLNRSVGEKYRERTLKRSAQGNRFLLLQKKGKNFFTDKLNELLAINEEMEKAESEYNKLYREEREKEYEAVAERQRELFQKRTDIITNDEDFFDFMEEYGGRHATRDRIERAIADVKNTDMTALPGQVFKVDVPENPYLLDEQKPLAEQPETVKEALAAVAEDADVKFKKNDDGRNIYRKLEKKLKSDKAASEMLSKHGIKGITYDGTYEGDGRSFVIFNDADVKVIQKFYQSVLGGKGGADNAGVTAEQLRQEIKAVQAWALFMSADTGLFSSPMEWFKSRFALPGELDSMGIAPAMEAAEAAQYQPITEAEFNEVRDSELYQKLPQNLQDAVEFALRTEPVASATGNEFQKDGAALTDKVADWYQKQYNGEVYRNEIGTVKLDKRAVKDSLGHGMGNAKAAAYTVAPEVIKHGFIYDRQPNWKNRGYDTVVFIAPVKIGTDDYICEVIVKQTKDRQGLYLHEVELTEKLPEMFKTALHGKSGSLRLNIARLIEEIKFGKDDKNLVVYHSLSKSNLEKALDLGGLPVPSLAIVNKEQPFDFANSGITLVGNKEMIDPHDDRNKVYDRDIWSKTFPLKKYKKPTEAKVKKFKENFGDYYKRSLSENELGSIIYTAQRTGPENAVNEFINSNGAILAYLEKVKNEKVVLPKRDYSGDILNKYYIDEKFIDTIKDIDINGDYDEQKKAVGKAYADMVERKDYSAFGKFAEKMKQHDIEEAGDMALGKVHNLITQAKKYVKSKGTETYDIYEVRDFLKEKVKDDPNYEKWARDVFEETLAGEPMIEVGNKLKPITLDNIVDAMTSGKTVGGQDSIFFSSGKIIASGAKQLKSIEDIRAEGKRLVSEEKSQENMEQAKDAIDDFIISLGNKNELGFVDPDPAARALAKIVKSGKPTKAALRKALDYEYGNKKVYSDKILTNGVAIAKKIKDLARYYFEAKPQRAVGLEEFTGAIVPTDNSFDDIASRLEEKGLTVVRSDNQVEAAKQMQEKTGQVFFQQTAYKGDISERARGAMMTLPDGRQTIALFKSANASTFIHEAGHLFLSDLEKYAGQNAKVSALLLRTRGWQDGEFNRLYNVKLRDDGRYIVTDKRSHTVYDNMESGFLTAADAAEYAKSELFARGFEKYCARGQAPTSFLDKTFAMFKKWLARMKSIVADEVKLNDDILSVYDRIFTAGSETGEDLEFYTAESDENVRKQFEELKEARRKNREAALLMAVDTANEPVPASEAFKPMRDITKSRQGLGEWWTKYIVPIDTRAMDVSEGLWARLQRYEFNLGVKMNRAVAQAEPFLKLWQKMTPEDTLTLDLILKNQAVNEEQPNEEMTKRRNAILDKYEGGREAYDAVVALLEKLRADGMAAGMDIGKLTDYFPRKVKYYNELMAELMNDPAMAEPINRAIAEAKRANANITDDELAEVIDKFIRSGAFRGKSSRINPGATKARTVEGIDNVLNQYYEPSDQALLKHIASMIEATENRKIWGYDRQTAAQEAEATQAEDKSFGAIIAAEMAKDGVIDATETKEAAAILNARLGEHGVSNPALKFLRDLAYVYTMGGVNTALRQLDDTAMAIYKAGLWPTLKTVFGKKEVTKKDLGIDSIAEEFAEATRMSKFLEKLFTWNGINLIDAFGKNLLTNSVLTKYRDMARNNPNELAKRIKYLEDETVSTVADFAEGKLTDNVKFVLFNELADVQPVTKSQMPEGYLTGGNMRVVYSLKTFLIRRMNTVARDAGKLIKQGIMTKDFGTFAKGFANFTRLAALCIMAGGGADWLIDLLYGRKFDIQDSILDNILGLFMLNRYTLYNARDRGPEAMIASSVIPPILSVPWDFGSDVYNTLFTDKKLKDAQSLKGIPIIGRFYYWWFGKGVEIKEKQEKRRRREARKKAE